MPEAKHQHLLPDVSIVDASMSQARRVAALTMIGAAVMTMGVLGERVWMSNQVAAAAERHATAQRLAGDVRLKEQQLLQAAQIAALTGDAGWVERYDRLIPELTQAIEHASLLAPPHVAQEYRAKTEQAAAEILRMRQSALDALQSGAHTAAGSLFNGARYTSQTALLRDATEDLTNASLRATEANLAQLRTRSYAVAGATLLLALGGAFALWHRLSKNLMRSRMSLMDAEAKMQRLAASDRLTGLDNRNALHDAMELRLTRARKLGEQVSVLMVDLDRFKPVNDINGHMVGDLVLKEVSQRLSRCLRQHDLRARFGGDEFVVVVDETPGQDTARASAERIVAKLTEPMRFGDVTVNIGASVGIARFPEHALSDDELLRKADAALYRAKKEGRGRLCLYDPKLDDLQADRQQLEQQLREGIARGELVPYYQPIVSLARRNVLYLELLCRWNHPDRGMLSPDKFIDLAESSGLIGPLTLALLQRACQDLSRFPSQWRLSINVAPQQIQDPELVPQFLSVLRKHGIPPSRLEVELTETALVDNTARAREVILGLKRAGMTVSLDDFGTGFSNLAYIAEMPFDKIKIDKGFVKKMFEKQESQMIVKAIVGLSQSLGKETVAEGVETEEQARALRELGCQNGQGFLFGRPVPARELAERAALAANQVAPVV